MPIIPFAEYKPDISDYEGTTTQTVLNVLPRGDGYGPFAAFSAYSSALTGTCRGFFRAIKSDGSAVIFAATATKLYKFNATTLAWDDVSKALGSYSSVSSTDQWQFEQFNNYVIAVQANVVPQYFDISSSTEFADLGGSPPQARYVSTVGRFLVLSGLLSNPFRVQWSGLNALTTWTSGVNQSDYQDLPDGGVVRGVAGGEFGNIFQDNCIRRMTYVPGSPVIFQIERLTQDRGLYAPYSLIRSGDKTFFLSAGGFYEMASSGYPQPIGKEKVDRTFLADLDTGNLQLVLGSSDPRSSRVFWAYKSNSGTAGLFDKLLCYDWVLQRFAPITLSGEYLGAMSQPGITLEGLDSISSSLDALTQSLDSYTAAVTPEIALFNSGHMMGFLRGTPMEATLQTAEQGTDGQRLAIKNLRPVTDAASVYGNVSIRENIQDTPTWKTESQVNGRGQCNIRASGRYSRLQARIPAGTSWTYAAGIEPDIVLEGLR